MSRPPFYPGPLTPWFERSLDDEGKARLRALRARGYEVHGFARTARGPFTARTTVEDTRGPLTVAGVGSSAGEALARLEGKVA